MASPSLSFSFCYPSNPNPNPSPNPNSSPSHRRQFKAPLAFCPTRRCPLAPLGRNSVPTKPPTRHPCVAQNSASESVISVSSAKETSEDGSDDAKVSAVLFDMDGVLCNSEDRSRLAAVDVFAELGVKVDTSDFIPFMGTGEANFLGGVARVYGLTNFDSAWAKSRFFQIYFEKYATPNSGLGYPGASDLIMKCKERGLKLALASSADRIKVEVNLAAAGLQESYFDAIVSADAFQNLKPAPDIFLAAAKTLGVPSNECVVIEDAVAGVQAAKAAGMRCIAVTTTLEEEKLLQEGPSLTRKDIASISLSDILNLKKAAGSEEEMSAGNTSDVQDVLNVEISLPGGLSTTRREILKLGSLVLGFSSIFVAASRWKAMSYMSPKALFNVLFQPNQPSFAKTPDANTSDRVSLFKRYISDLEDRGGGDNVPEFQPRLEWLNTTPLRVGQDLKGKVLVLDFWTYCCINCMHLLPDLDYLEKKYKDKPLTVVGVHSAKFDNEKDLEAIRNAVLRYNITHPVVNDGDMIMWRQLGVTSWPTLAVVSPKGKLIGTLIGEGHRQDLDDLIEAALQYYGDKKLLDNRPIPIALEKDKDPRLLSSPLKYPGKITTDLANGRLFISDSNHNRIVVTDLDGNFIQQIGGVNGEGFQDGSFDDASFNRPQGVAYNSSKNVLYVADTENHALREVDFVNEMVRTLAGNGEKGSDYKGGKLGTSQMLNSPWDLCLEPESRSLYIAMAGQHQIWRYSLADGTTQVFSGDGYERNVNGNRGGNTSYAQPSGLSLAKDSREIFVADSESSSIRAMNLQTGGSRLLAGGDPAFSDNLFQFGDKDGIGSEAQFQHPLGLLYDSSGLMYITDSYNHKIKVLDPKTRKVKTVAGTGRAGFKDGSGQFAQLSEPAGLAQGPNGKIFVADTNNSTIRVLEWNGKDEAVISTLVLNDVKPPMPSKPSKQRRLRRRSAVDTEIIRLNPISAQSGDLKIKISLPNGYHFTKEATSKFEVDSETLENVIVDPAAGVISPDGQALLHFSRMTEASTKLQINCKVYYCEEDAVCLYKALAFEVPLDVISSSEISSSKLVPLTYAIKAPSLNGSLSPSSM